VDAFWTYADTEGATLAVTLVITVLIFCAGYAFGSYTRARVPAELRLFALDKKREVLEREHRSLLRVPAQDVTSDLLIERRRVSIELVELIDQEAQVIADELNLRDEEDERSGGRG
jgi:hypothetical protein